MKKRKKYFVVSRKYPIYIKFISRHLTLSLARKAAKFLISDQALRCEACESRVDCLIIKKCEEIQIVRLVKGKLKGPYPLVDKCQSLKSFKGN